MYTIVENNFSTGGTKKESPLRVFKENELLLWYSVE